MWLPKWLCWSVRGNTASVTGMKNWFYLTCQLWLVIDSVLKTVLRGNPSHLSSRGEPCHQLVTAVMPTARRSGAFMNLLSLVEIEGDGVISLILLYKWLYSIWNLYILWQFPLLKMAWSFHRVRIYIKSLHCVPYVYIIFICQLYLNRLEK